MIRRAAAAPLAAAALTLSSTPGSATPLPPTPMPVPREAKPRVLLMTALPLIWGDRGAFDPSSRPAASYRALQARFDMAPVDVLDAKALAGAKLLLLAQPRWLAPHELVAIDEWVRGGGAALILSDPHLDWPSPLPLGDVRRAPPVGLLDPLLSHWGVTLAGGPVGPRIEMVEGRRLTLFSPGTLTAAQNCTPKSGVLLRCRVGRGRAILIADADLLRDDLWDGEAAMVIEGLLDELAGIKQPGQGAAAAPDRGPRISPAALIVLGIAFALVAAGLWRRRRRRG
jgi:hypothetical protein